MTAERWAHIKEIFSAAVEMPETARRSYLESACGADSDLRGEVERLLADHASQTLPSPAVRVLAQVPELTPGEMLAHYRVEAKLGEGGMGAVYRAFDTRLERQVAVKVLLPDPYADPDRQQRLMREARAASALNHPNIVTVYEIASERGLDFIGMEYVEGRSLATLIPSKGLPVGRALDYAIQIADALAQAHAAGVVHRDLKPANVMVNGEGRIKLLDFGLARRVPLDAAATATLTVPGAVMGTPAYMSPEQAEGKKADHRSDIFSFGTVLYEMLSGHRPFAARTTLALLAAILHEQPQPLREIVPDLPRELDRVIALCLKKDPARRFAHMGDLRLQLEDLRQELESGTLATVPGPAHQRRKRLSAAALGATALVLVTAASLGVWLNRGRDPSSEQTMTRLTADVGLTFQPAISPDGKLLAYSSDRAGRSNLDVWVQHVAGGTPIQLTNDPADDSEPSFSPDGSEVVFRSEREGGGIYVVSSLGGDARLIARRGGSPRFSPDGSQIAYSDGRVGYPGLASGIYVVASKGGPPRRLLPEFRVAGLPVWTGDGRHLLFQGFFDERDQEQSDWWVVPVDGGPAIRTRAGEVLRQRRAWNLYGSPKAWIGSRLLFSAPATDSGNLWQIPISTRNWEVAGEPQRLTFGAGKNIEPSVSAGGQVVFTSLMVNRDVWSLGLDPLRAKVVGELKRLTQETESNRDPTVSRDGAKVAFVTRGRGQSRLRIRDVATAKEAVLSGIPNSHLYPGFSMDGSKLAFAGPRQTLYVVPVRGGVAEKVCEDCGNAPAWSSDGTKLLYDRFGRQRRHVGLFDTVSGANRPILEHPVYSIVQPQYCPGDRWMSFAYVTNPDRARVAVAPLPAVGLIPESEWILVSDGSGFDSRPRWSPDGNLLYFTSDRDGFRCIWAQRLDPATKRPIGPLMSVYHFHDPKRLLSDIPELGFGVAKDKMVFNLTERTGNIWAFQLPQTP